MDMKDENSIKLFFDAFSNVGRFRILELLLDGPLTVNEISEGLVMGQTLVSHNLKCLSNCMFVKSYVTGRQHTYSIRSEAIYLVKDMMKHIDRYEKHLISCDIINKKVD